MKHLTKLGLDGASVTDAGLKGLAGLECLTELNLEFTPVSGAGFKDLVTTQSSLEDIFVDLVKLKK